jgi:hypothetical protein
MSCILIHKSPSLGVLPSLPVVVGDGDRGVDHGLLLRGCRPWLALSDTSSSFGRCPAAMRRCMLLPCRNHGCAGLIRPDESELDRHTGQLIAVALSCEGENWRWRWPGGSQPWHYLIWLGTSKRWVEALKVICWSWSLESHMLEWVSISLAWSIHLCRLKLVLLLVWLFFAPFHFLALLDHFMFCMAPKLFILLGGHVDIWRVPFYVQPGHFGLHVSTCTLTS